MQYKTCPYCGAHLDFGECCDCRDEKKPKEEGNMRKNLQAARKAANMSQLQTAEYLGIKPRAYQNIEYGITLGSIKHWDALEDLFGVPQRKLRENTE